MTGDESAFGSRRCQMPLHGHTVQGRDPDPDPAEHWEHYGSVWGAGMSAGDDVVNGVDRRRV